MLNTVKQNAIAEKEWKELFEKDGITDELVDKMDLSYLDEDDALIEE